MGEKRNFKELKKILNEGEQIERTIVAWYDHHQGVLAITDKRLLFVGKGLLSGLTVKDLPLGKIINVDYQIKSMESFFTIHGSGHKIEFDGVIGSKDKVKDFVEHLNSKINKHGHAKTKNDDFISKLE
ncbi:MAG TPA: PH domain-containing protein [Bacillales bacterium]